MQTDLQYLIERALPWLYALMLSMWGGVVQYAERVRQGHPWSWRDMALDVVVCSFAGLLSFFVCQAVGVDGWRQAVVISVSSHQGTRAIALLANFRDRFLGGPRP